MDTFNALERQYVDFVGGYIDPTLLAIFGFMALCVIVHFTSYRRH